MVSGFAPLRALASSARLSISCQVFSRRSTSAAMASLDTPSAAVRMMVPDPSGVTSFRISFKRLRSGSGSLREMPAELPPGTYTRKRPASEICMDRRAPLWPMGSLVAWTSTWSPAFSACSMRRERPFIFIARQLMSAEYSTPLRSVPMSMNAASMLGSTFCTRPRYTSPMMDVCVSEVTKCSTSRSSSSTPTCVTQPWWSVRSRSRTTMVRSTDSRRARNSASEMTWRLRDCSRRSARRRRAASRRVEPRMATGSSTTGTSGLSSSASAFVPSASRESSPRESPDSSRSSRASSAPWASSPCAPRPRPRPRPRRRRRTRSFRLPTSWPSSESSSSSRSAAVSSRSSSAEASSATGAATAAAGSGAMNSGMA